MPWRLWQLSIRDEAKTVQDILASQLGLRPDFDEKSRSFLFKRADQRLCPEALLAEIETEAMTAATLCCSPLIHEPGLLSFAKEAMPAYAQRMQTIAPDKRLWRFEELAATEHQGFGDFLMAPLIPALFSDPHLMATARCFLKHELEVSAAAKALYLHRNSLLYRLERIQAQTGFQLRRFTHAYHFHYLEQIFSAS